MTSAAFDVLGIGNAIVDVFSRADDAFLKKHALVKGAMTLIDEAPETTGARARRPRIVWVFGALALLFLLIGLAGGSYQGKLGKVQKSVPLDRGKSFWSRMRDALGA